MGTEIETLKLGPGQFKILKDTFISPYNADLIKVEEDSVEVKIIGDPLSREVQMKRDMLEKQL